MDFEDSSTILNSEKIAYLGNLINITCFVSTIMDIVPQRQLTNEWTYPQGSNIDQYEISASSNLSTILMISQLQFYNRGVYRCSSLLSICGNTQSANHQEIQLIVQSKLF